MIQFNLLPDVKVQYIKTRRVSRLVVAASILIGIAAIITTTTLYFRAETQESTLESLTQEADIIFNEIKYTEIQVMTDKVNSGPSDISELLTIQAQLATLTRLHEQKVAAERIDIYIAEILAEGNLLSQGVEVSSIRLDFEANTFTIGGTTNGTADGQVTSLQMANILIDTVEFTMYTTGKEGIEQHLFELDPPRLSGSDQEKATFSLSGTFDPIVFDAQVSAIKIIVPHIDTTHIEIGQVGGS